MIYKETNKFIMPNLKPVIFNILILFLVLSCSNNDSEVIVEQPLEYFEELMFLTEMIAIKNSIFIFLQTER